MQPRKISVGLTATLAGFACLLVGPRIEFLAPYWPVILAENGVAVVWHAGLAIATASAALFTGMYEDY